MDQIIQAIEVFAMVTGVVYLVLEILQKNSMWVVGILTSTACAFEFAITHVWASMGLNIYYVVMSVIGLLQWRKASEAVGEGEIHLSRLPRAVALWSAALFVLGSLVLMQVLRAAGDPAPRLDAVAVTLSVIATWWLDIFYHHHLPHHGPVLDGRSVHGIHCQCSLWVFPLEKKGEIRIFG